MQISKKLFLILYLLFLANINFANGPIVSPLGPQSVIAGGAIKIFFSAVGPSISFESSNLPDFVEMVDNEDKSGYFLVNSSFEDVGIYQFLLSTTGLTGTTTKVIHLEVKAIAADATIYYCDPVNGSNSNVGDSLNPFGSLQSLFATVPNFKAGDIIFCRDGFHGYPQISGINADFVTISVQSGHQASIERLRVYGASNWIISGLDISPQNAGINSKAVYVKLISSAKNVILENCKIYSINDATEWTKEDWYANSGDGILVEGTYNTIRNNFLLNTYFSATIENTNNNFDYNTIDRFGGDAIRGIAHHLSISYNVVKNATVDDYDLPGGNHDDAFQSWSFGGSVRNIVLRGNQFFDHTFASLPQRSSVMQGLVDFDGFAEGWTVENNLVVLDHPHGIALYGAKNCKIVNNTVIRNPLELYFFGSNPWIRVNPHKDSRPSSGNLLRNNLSNEIIYDNYPGNKDHNKSIRTFNDYFVDYRNWDFHLRSGSVAIDGGIAEDAPTIDNDGYRRAENENPDLGCFEFEASIFDFEKPIMSNNYNIDSTTNSCINFSWDAATDNKGVAYYQITTNGIFIQTTNTSCQLLGLKAATNYSIEIKAVDFYGNVSDALVLEETTTPLPDGATYQIKVPVHWKDQQIWSNNRLAWVGLPEYYIGKRSSLNASAVFPFKYPEIIEGHEVKSVDFAVYYKGHNNSPASNVAVYGLDYRSSADVNREDHWQGAFDQMAAIGTPLINSFVNVDSEIGMITLDDNNKDTLASFVRTQVQNGMKANNYILLRLNVDVDTEGSYRYFRFGSAEMPTVENRPYLIFTIGKMSTAVDDVNDVLSDLSIYPNPISTNKSITLHFPNQENKKYHLKVSNINGQVIWKTNQEINIQNQFTIPKQFTHAGLYFLQLNDGNRIYTKKIIVN